MADIVCEICGKTVEESNTFSKGGISHCEECFASEMAKEHKPTSYPVRNFAGDTDMRHSAISLKYSRLSLLLFF